MAASRKELTVIEGNDPLLTVSVKLKKADGSKEAYDLTGSSAEFYIKSSADQADGEAVKYSTGDGSITILDPGTEGVMTIQLDAAGIGTPGTKFYRVDVIKNTKRQTVRYGPLKVVNA